MDWIHIAHTTIAVAAIIEIAWAPTCLALGIWEGVPSDQIVTVWFGFSVLFAVLMAALVLCFVVIGWAFS